MISGHSTRTISYSALLLSLSLAAGCGGTDTNSSGGGGATTTTTPSGGTGTGGATGGTGGVTGGTGGTGGTTTTPGPAPQDILTTDLQLDLTALEGIAKIVVKPAEGSSEVKLEVGGLTLTDVKANGAMADYQITDGIAAIPVADGSQPVTLDIAYTFSSRPSDAFDGWMADTGVSMIWPYFCSNLFPCNSYPDDGVKFTMNVTGYDQSLVAVYPKTTTMDAPSYMPAIALGAFLKDDLGTTTAGTSVSSWYFAGQEADSADGTAHLLAVIDFYEKTYGPYPFGKETGSVSANWGPGGLGGMEHHPFVHVASDEYYSEEVHAHEAAHAWFGDGVRIACWEDFMLSEGTVTYMAAHSLEKVGGPDLWPQYVDTLGLICSGMVINTIALPSTCNEIDLFNHPLWSQVPYIKGACFYEEVADLIGQDKVDEALSEVFKANVGGAIRMNDMIAVLESKATADQVTKIEKYKTDWLLKESCPINYATRCGTHQPL